MNWTGGRLRRHSEINARSRKQAFGKSSASNKGYGPYQITLFNSLAKYQNVEERKGKVNNSRTAGPDNTATQSLPQSSSNTGTKAVPRSPDRLERMKRRLLETTDWAAVGAARPVQVAFTPQEDLERFGKRRRLTRDDHERLNTSTTTAPRARKDIPLEGDIPENLEIWIDGRRLDQQDTAMDEDSHPKGVSSHSMLLDEESLGSNHRVDAQGPQQSRNRAARSASRLSMISDCSQLGYEVPTLPYLRLDDQGAPVPMQQDFSGSIDWFSGESMLQSLQSNASSSIIPQPESPVRRRFTIDDQAMADRQGPIVSSPVATTQFLRQGQVVHERSPEGRMRSSLGPSQPGSRLAIQTQHDNKAGPKRTYSSFGWLPQVHSDIQHEEDSQLAMASTAPIRELSIIDRWSNGGKEREPPVRIYGQPVVFGDSNIHSDSHAREQSELRGSDMDVDAGNIFEFLFRTPSVPL